MINVILKKLESTQHQKQDISVTEWPGILVKTHGWKLANAHTQKVLQTNSHEKPNNKS